jgi:hypothetical protein
MTPRNAVLALALTACCLAFAPAAQSVARPQGDLWSVSVDRSITAGQLGLPADASARALGRAAIERSLSRLVGRRRLGSLRFAGEPLPPGRGGRRTHGLRFRQRIGGLRVLYSQLGATVAPGRVRSVAGTVVPLNTMKLAGVRRISAGRAQEIARRVVPAAVRARRAELVAYAGEPAKPRSPRRAYVVEVMPAATGSDDSPAAICVVVDATTGKVLKRWRGFAARPRKRNVTGQSALAAAKTVLIQLVDAKGAVADVTPNYRDVYTMGDPRSFGLDSPLQQDTFGTLSPPFFTVNSWVNAVTQFFCVTREYCGRDSGLDGSYNRHFYTVNWGGSASRYVHAGERIYIDVDSTTQPQVIAHEQGHSIDFHFRDDFVATFEGDEVEEALAEMFAYDFERDRILTGATGPRVSSVLADPSDFALPERYTDYSCTSTDEHRNGYILAHAYWRFVQRVGHNVAGHVLQGVPWQLPALREFGDVRTAMERASGTLLVPGLNGGPPRRVSSEVAAAFGEVGVLASSRRTLAC